MTPKQRGEISCPDKDGNVDGVPMWKAMAFPFHLIGKTCKKCGKPTAEHGVSVTELDPEDSK